MSSVPGAISVLVKFPNNEHQPFIIYPFFEVKGHCACLACFCRFRNVSFEITSIDVGVFEVTGRFLGRQIEKVELVFQVGPMAGVIRVVLGGV